MITIRKAALSDIPELHDLYQNTILSVNSKDYSREEVLDWASCGKDETKWEKLIQDTHFIVAEDSNFRIMGFSSINQEGYIHFMFVHKDFQGQGIASALYRKIEEYALMKNIHEITSEVSITAKPFFERLGFSMNKEQKRKANQLYLKNFRMSKKISFTNNNIKKAFKEDLKEILALQKTAFKPISEIVQNENIPPMTETYEEIYQEYEKSLFLKYVEGDKIIGSVRGKITKDNTCYIGRLIVHPRYQNRSIGRALMKEIECYFSDCNKYILFTSPDTPNTLHLYNKLGYREVSRKDHDDVSMVYMEKNNKPLQELTNEELWQLFPIIHSEYQEEWEKQYQEEKEILEEIIGKDFIFRINHIGSTSVPGLLAKPTIDILVEIKKEVPVEKLIKKMESFGYIYSPQPQNPPPHIMFMKGYTLFGFEKKVYHIHVRYPGDWDELYFRDYLREYPEIAEEYEKLKKELIKKFKHDRDAYTDAKTDFIRKVTSLAKKKFSDRHKI